jgi:hypothetical protein
MTQHVDGAASLNEPRKVLLISHSDEIDFSNPLADIHEFFRTLKAPSTILSRSDDPNYDQPLLLLSQTENGRAAQR